MEMEVVMAMWLAETLRLHNKTDELTVTEEFFVNLTLEFDRARNERAPDDYRGRLLTQIELYLSGDQDQTMANVLTAAGKAASQAVGNEASGNA